MNIVIIEALLFGLSRLVDAADKMNIKIYLLTHNKEIYSYEIKKIHNKNLVIIETDTFSKDNIIEQCNKIGNISGIINLTDTWTEISQYMGEKYNLNRQNRSSISICRDKSLLRETLFTKGLSKGICINIEPNIDLIPDDILYPVIVKDPHGTGSKNVWIAQNIEDLKRIFQYINSNTKIKKILIETYFLGPLYSVETVTYKNQTKVLCVTSRILSNIPHFMEKFFSLPIDTSNKELANIEQWIEKILNSISYDFGFAHTEFIITPHGFEVVEVNPRLGGVLLGEAICQIYDYNIYKAMLEMAIGVKPELLDISLNIKKHIGMGLIYADQTGVFDNIDTEYINKNKTKIYAYAKKGTEIKSIVDQSASVGVALLEAETTELALLNIISEINKIKVNMNTKK